MSVDKKLFLPSFSRQEAKKEDWEARRTPPNANLGKAPFDRAKRFTVPVETEVRQKLDLILKPERLKIEEPDSQNQNLPPGYALIVELYKDGKFMNEVRLQGDTAINSYLNAHRPEILDYLRMHKLRVVANIIPLHSSLRTLLFPLHTGAI